MYVWSEFVPRSPSNFISKFPSDASETRSWIYYKQMVKLYAQTTLDNSREKDILWVTPLRHDLKFLRNEECEV